MDQERLSNIIDKILRANMPDGDTDAVGATDYRNLLNDAKILAEYCAEHIANAEPTSFIERLKLEHKQLFTRMTKLAENIARGSPGAGGVQRELLKLQQPIMSLYLQVLDLRINKLGLQEIADERAVASQPALGEPREIGDHDEDRDGPVPFDV